MKHIFSYLLLLFSFLSVYAQLGFCNGNSGAPIFVEDFGAGPGSVSLPNGTTTYLYSNGFPNDSFYTVRNNTFGNPYDWQEIEDHTPNDSNGRFLIVNADFTAGEFYKTTVTGLCEFTTYEFSAWLLNLLKVPGFCVDLGIEIPINVKFQIWDSNETTLIASGDTGDIYATAAPTWGEFGLVFQTLENQQSVVLKMLNNGGGGCGNDLVIDDIEFKTCGDNVVVTDELDNTSLTICNSETPYATTLTSTPDFAVFTSHFYQWQESSDGVTWQDIVGETNQNINLNVTSGGFYRTKVSEFEDNLSNEQCILLSDLYQISINPNPPAPNSNGDVSFDCSLNEAILSVTSNSNTSVNWYDAASNGQLLQANSLTYTANAVGTYYAETIDNITGCVSTSRTAVITETYTAAPTADTPQTFCGSVLLQELQTNGENIKFYSDQSGGTLLDETTEISEDTTVYITQTIDDCESQDLVVVEIIIENPTIYTDNFEILYCLDSSPTVNLFDASNEFLSDDLIGFFNSIDDLENFENIIDNPNDFEVNSENQLVYARIEEGLCYEIYPILLVSENCALVIPQAISPNNDGYNDVFDIQNLYDVHFNHTLKIYNRYGLCVFEGTNDKKWAGLSGDGKLVPVGTYFYVLTLNNEDNEVFTGWVYCNY
jgi:gliding motility-associated-like protein